MTDPLVQPTANGFLFQWQDANVQILIDRIWRSVYGERAQCQVKSIQSKAKSNHRPPFTEYMSLGNADDKRRVAKRLGGLTEIKEAEWLMMLDWACAATIQRYQRGNPLVYLSEVIYRPNVPFLIEKLLPEDEITIVYGDGDSCKSWISQALLISALTGLPLDKRLLPTRRIGRAGILDFEASGVETYARRQAYLLNGMRIPGKSIKLWYRECHGKLIDQVQDILDLIEQEDVDGERTDIILIDSLGPAAGGSLKDDEVVIPLMNSLRALGRTIIGVAHVTKEDAKNTTGRAEIYGNVFFKNQTRNSWEIRSDRNDDPRLALFQGKTNFRKYRDPLGLRLTFDDPNQSVKFDYFDVAESPLLLGFADPAIQLRVALSSGEKTTGMLAKSLEWSEQRVLKMGKADSAIEQIGGGKGRGNESSWRLRTDAWIK